ncbi:MAG: Gfo/Idh/MocA family oxidoreductase [Planctomycetes bacterium]|nr:Gfo/Idh/MocA family oxidoreductase [Planctomycetota bacterium]
MAMRFGVIGFEHGHIYGMVAGLKALEGVALVVIASKDEGLLGDGVKRYGVPAYLDYREMLDKEQLDFAAICPVNSEKCEVIIECARRQVHVVADKPLLTDLEQLPQVEAALSRNPVAISMLLSLRFSPPYYTLKKVVERGLIGEVVSIIATRPHKLSLPSRTPPMLDMAFNGGVLVDLGIHDLDMVRWVTADEAASVTAHHSNRRFSQLPRFTDNSQVMLRMRRGSVAFVAPDWLTPDASKYHGDCRFFVTGANGTVETDSVRGEVRLCTNSEPHRVVPNEQPPVSFYADFVRRLSDPGYQPLLGNEDVLKSMRMALVAKRAAERGETLTM